MNRDAAIERVQSRGDPWDVVIVGGGATGLGCAVDSALRGYSTVLFERGDLAQGTSSRSTKLIHGGVRYLRYGNLRLVLESLRERGRLRANAPHLVGDIRFVVPTYTWWEGPFYGVGLRVYDGLAGRHGLARSRNLSRDDTIALVPTVKAEGLRGGVSYHDAQFDDARLAVDLASTATNLGAVVINYASVNGFDRADGAIRGVEVRDVESDRHFRVEAKVVVNATGVGVDVVRRVDDANAASVVRPSRGSHVVLDRSFLPGETAIMVPRTDDGRVMFAIPWHGRVLIGTTEVEVDDVCSEPTPSPEEVDYLLAHAGRYLAKPPTRSDVRSAFAGLRPLVGTDPSARTASIARDHEVMTSDSGLVTVAGGKWTTYRKMAEDTIDRAAAVAGLDPRPCATHDHLIHGHDGEAASEIQYLIADSPELAEPIDDRLDFVRADVVWAVRKEMARTVEDVLARRTRALFLDAAAAVDAAPQVAQLMARELGRDAAWVEDQVVLFDSLATGYLPG